MPLLVISLQALLSRANANWAVSAYAGGAVLVAIWALQTERRAKLLRWGVIGQIGLCFTVGVIALYPTARDAVGLANATKRMVAWPETTDAVRDVIARGRYAGIGTDNRLVHYDLDYYGIDDSAPLYMWRLNAAPAHHADLTRALPAGEVTYLIVSHYESYAEYFREDFATLTPLDPLRIPIGGDKIRTLYLYAGTGYTPTTRTDRR